MTEVCAHPDAVPVITLTGETVAALCPGCDAQLPAEWIGCEHDGVDVSTFDELPGAQFLCSRCGGAWREVPNPPLRAVSATGRPAGITKSHRRLTDDEYREIRARWLERHGPRGATVDDVGALDGGEDVRRTASRTEVETRMRKHAERITIPRDLFGPSEPRIEDVLQWGPGADG